MALMDRIDWAAAAAVTALAGAHVLALASGSLVPDIAAPGLRPGEPGIRLASLRGKVVYVDFWSSTSVPSRESMPFLDQEFRRLSGRGFMVVGVNKDTMPADAERFLRRIPVSFPLVADADDRLANAFAVKAVPSGYLVDRDGRVRFVHRGFTSAVATELKAQVEQLLAEAR